MAPSPSWDWGSVDLSEPGQTAHGIDTGQQHPLDR
jgi:hypothetical protein